MHDLVKSAIEAYGGLEQWKQVRQISATLRASGAGFKQRGPVGEAFAQTSTRLRVNTREQRVTMEPFIVPGQRGTYEPSRTSVESLDGSLLEELRNPRESLETLPAGTPWSKSQLIYFLGYSVWMYFTLPFTFLKEGIKCEDAEPWIENGAIWRGLKVTYPDSYPSHSTEQIHYFDDNGFMRRQDYTVDVRQDLKIAHYLYDDHKFDGFVFPTKRRICLRGPDGQPLWDRTLISADFDDFQLVSDERESGKHWCADTCD
jgi:hypothetical protein